MIWLTLADICKHFRCGRATVRRYIREGMPGARIGKSWRFALEQVDPWLADRALDTSRERIANNTTRLQRRRKTHGASGKKLAEMLRL